MKNISIIPARGGSKGVPRKNIKNLLGKPLIVYTIEQSLNSKLIDETIVSTEDAKIKKISKQYGATVIDRPEHLAGDTTSTEAVLMHLLRDMDYEIGVLLQCTSPLRKPDDIDNAIMKLMKNDYDSLLSVCQDHHFYWNKLNSHCKPINYEPNNRPRRQDIAPEDIYYQENGSIYVFTKKCFDTYSNRLGGHTGMYEMEPKYSIEIDIELDFILIEAIMNWEKKKI